MPAPIAWSDRDLAAYLASSGLPAQLVRPGVPTPTVPDAARALGVGPEAILKSLLFEAAGEPLLVIAAGLARVRVGALARALELPRRTVALASPEAALAATGYAVGAMPPFGHRRPLDTFVDSVSVPLAGVVYGGGGSDDVMLRLDARTLLEATQARWLPLTAGGGAKETT
ncbi:MAG: YbaK/EbsC family protein [Deinococcales bacterium]